MLNLKQKIKEKRQPLKTDKIINSLKVLLWQVGCMIRYAELKVNMCF